MPDITMCPGNSCPKKDTCYRHTAKPSMLQSYFTETPFAIIQDNFECEYYWDDGAKVVKKRTTKKNVKQI